MCTFYSQNPYLTVKTDQTARAPVLCMARTDRGGGVQGGGPPPYKGGVQGAPYYP